MNVFPEHWSFERILHHGLAEILVNQEKQMSALTDLQAAVAKLKIDVEALLAQHQAGATDTDLQALTSAVNAIDAEIVPPPAG